MESRVEGTSLLHGTLAAALVVFFALAAVGCGPTGDDDSGSGGNGGNSNVDYSTLSEASLVGTWRHDSFSSSPDGGGMSVDSDITWTFRKDGTGTYHQKNQFTDADREFDWTLDGKDIKFGSSVNYTVVEYSENEMVWRNVKSPNASGDYYFVSRE